MPDSKNGALCLTSYVAQNSSSICSTNSQNRCKRDTARGSPGVCVLAGEQDGTSVFSLFCRDSKSPHMQMSL